MFVLRSYELCLLHLSDHGQWKYIDIIIKFKKGLNKYNRMAQNNSRELL